MRVNNIVWVIAWHEYIINVRRAGFIFFTLLVPAFSLLGLVATTVLSGPTVSFLEEQVSHLERPTGVVDHTGLFVPIAPAFADRFQAFADEAGARQALLDDVVGAYFVIPPDYVATGELTAYSRGGLFDALGAVDSPGLRAFLLSGLLDGRVEPALAERAAQPAHVTPVSLDEHGRPTAASDPLSTLAGFIIPYLLSLFLIVSIFTAASYLLRSVSEEKETRVIEVLLSSVSATDLLAGKVIGLGALGLTQIGVWLASGFLLSRGLGLLAAGVEVTLEPDAFALSTVYFLLGYLLYGTVMAAAGSLGTSLRESQQMASLFSFGAALPLMFNGLILANPNAALVRVLSYFPFTAPTAMMLRLPLAGQLPIVDVVVSLAGLLLAIPCVLWAGGKVFRMGLLLHGKRLDLRQLWRAFAQA